MENGTPKDPKAAETGEKAEKAEKAGGGEGAVSPNPAIAIGEKGGEGEPARSKKAARKAAKSTSGAGTPPGEGGGEGEGKEKKDRSGTKRKLKPEAILTHTFGDLMKFSKKAPDVQAPFRKYDTFAVAMAEQPREERLMMYGFLMGLALTAHARRIKDASKRRFVFDLKNRIFLAVANNFALRKVLNFRLCQSKRFKVLKYCEECTRKNTEAGLPQRQWKFCPKCTVDRNYYNVLSMFHKHGEGGASLFLGNELITHVRGLRVLKRAKYGQLDEEITFRKYTFSPKNLVALDLASAMDAARKVTDLLEKARDSEIEKQAAFYAQTGGGMRPRPFGAPGPHAGPVGRGGPVPAGGQGGGGFGGSGSQGPFPRRDGAPGFGSAPTADGGVRRAFVPGPRPAAGARPAPIRPRDPNAASTNGAAAAPSPSSSNMPGHSGSESVPPREPQIRPRTFTGAPGGGAGPSRIIPAAARPVSPEGAPGLAHGTSPAGAGAPAIVPARAAPAATPAEEPPARGGDKPEGEGSQ